MSAVTNFQKACPTPSNIAVCVVASHYDRVFATTTNQPGVGGTAKYDGNPVADMADLVSRDKLHSSVVLWSFCNEGGCGDGRTSPAQVRESIQLQLQLAAQ